MEWFNFPGSEIFALLSWVDRPRTTFVRLSRLELAQYGRKGHDNPTQSSQSALSELLINSFGFLRYLVGGDTGY